MAATSKSQAGLEYKALTQAIETLNGMVSASITATAATSAEIKADLNAKHQENVERRRDMHTQIDKIGSELGGLTYRVGLAELTLRSIVGDNTGDSGLLHEVKKGQEQLKDQVKDGLSDLRQQLQDGLSDMKSEMQSVKQTASTAPTTFNWMNKWLGVAAAIALIAGVATVIGVGLQLLHILAKTIK